MAYADEIAAANRLKTREERFAARNAVRAKYGMEPERKTRGGLAEIYDRNKGLVRTAASGLAGLFGGPAAATLVGGAIGGLDRPGKRGIGFDVGRAARGAAQGYAAGGLGAAARGMISPGMAGMSSTVPATRMEGATQALKSYFQPGAQALATGAEKVGTFVKQNPVLTAQALQSGLSAYQAAQAGQMAQQEADLAEQLRQEEQERKNRLARLLAPALQAQARPYTPSR